MNIRQAKAALRGVARDIHREAVRVARTTVAAGENEAKKLSSGPFSMVELAKKDHPYARRHGSPRLDPSVINVQSGVFRQSWFTSLPTMAQSKVSARLVNDSEVADFLQYGTRKMFARPIGDRLQRFIQDRALREIEFSMKSIERKHS
jgi:hypothetical protein